MALCVICQENLGSSYVCIKERGRRTLVEASLKRQDGLHELFQTADPLQVHAACRKGYTRETSIKAAKRKDSGEPTEDDVAPTTLRSRTHIFDIVSHCLYCAEVIETSSKLPLKRRKPFSNVETIEYKDSVSKRARERCDEWGNTVAKRIEGVIDLVAVEAKYHRACGVEFFTSTEKIKSVGKPADAVRDYAFNALCSFIDENDECQFSISVLMEHIETFLQGEEGYSIKYCKQKLNEHYGEDIIITSIPGKTSIVSFRDSAHRILREKWVADRTTGKYCENDRIIDMAASIILDDIRLSIYHLSEYPTMKDTDNGNTLIPDSLKRFLHKLLDPKDKQSTVVNRRCTAIAHSIISACRPRSFISPLLLAIALYIHRKYASRELIDILSSISFADDYKEVQHFENSLIPTCEPSYGLNGFTQFVFDNADFNVATLTGHNTFHALGGIACVTPSGTVYKSPIKRTAKAPSTELFGTFAQIPIKTYSKPAVPGLQSVTVEPLKISDSQSLQATAFDFVWMLGHVLNLSSRLPWSGFMKTVVINGEFHTSRIETLPFINLDPSNPSTI